MTPRARPVALLLFAALFSGCMSAQSDRSRQRSGPIRSVPVAADIKRDETFDCPEEFGYYPHPTDCTLYYVCVFGGALLESCTGGLMYSHELQTCDWPRNVGCDATGSGAERVVDIERDIEVERLNERERERPPPPPRRNPPPPPPRAQPNPVVTSRGQPKLTHQEYIEQQQLYEEVDDLPPAEEIERDRQQRVYRGQPSTIGQVQRDRDGYSQANPGRNLNSNIIPSSLSQGSGKIGSFSFGTQVDDRRTVTVTQTPQTYSDVTDNQLDRHSDIVTNEILDSDVKELKGVVLRKKREVTDNLEGINVTRGEFDAISDRSDIYADDEIKDFDLESDEDGLSETDRGKRQVRHGRYYLKNGYKNAGGKNWGSPKPVKLYDFTQYNSNPPQNQNTRNQPTYNSISFQDASRQPTFSDNIFTTSNPFLQFTTNANLYPFQAETSLHKPFKPSLPDLYSLRPQHNPINTATHIITKSPPISSLSNNENPFSALAGGFFNNVPNQFASNQVIYKPKIHNHHDSSQLSSSVVTDRPVLVSSSPRIKTNNRLHQKNVENVEDLQKEHNNLKKPVTLQNENKPHKYRNKDYDDKEDDEEEDDEDEESDNDSNSSEKNEDDESDDDFHYHKQDFPKPPYEFTHPSNKYADISNPFADPNFDFDAFLSKLRGDEFTATDASTVNPNKQNNALKEEIKEEPHFTPVKSSTLSYKGMSTPRPFTLPSNAVGSWPPNKNENIENTNNHSVQRLVNQNNNKQHIQLQQQMLNVFNNVPQLSAIPLNDATRPKLKPPNFKDNPQLPINHNFNGNGANYYAESVQKPNNKMPNQINLVSSTVTPKTYLFVSGKNTPILFSTPKPIFRTLQNAVTMQAQGVVTGRPYLLSTIKPNLIFKQSTSNPIVTNQQIPTKFQQYRIPILTVTQKPAISSDGVSEIPSLESIFSQAIKPVTPIPTTTSKTILQSSTSHESIIKMPKPRRRPIPKPSPEMNDYYYDEGDEQYYYEPAVKPKYMPSSEVRPQRPLIAQNYEEYDDEESYEEDEEPVKYENPIHVKRPLSSNNNKAESVTKNVNDVSVVTKAPLKGLNKNNVNGKIPVPVMMDFSTTPSTVLRRPEVSNYQIVHANRNRTHLQRPHKRPNDNGPNTNRPPKYLNQTTLRPYTVRHRLAKPTTMKMPKAINNDDRQVRGRIRQPSTVTRVKSTTPHDNHNQETRYTKTRHDGRTNSLEPTESVSPPSYSASPRPKMLYNGSQTYNPTQFDPYYVYDEDGELYKDTDYVQQFNTASLRPAVQQTYRGTPPPPPARRPVETYSTRPASADEYDDALIQGQINTQNQYQTAVRQSTRGEGNELGYDHNPSSVRTTLYEATSISTTPSTTTSTSTTTTQRPTSAPLTEAMTPPRYTQRSPTDERHSSAPTPNPLTFNLSTVSNPLTNTEFNFSSLAKPFERTNNSLRFRQTVSKTDFFKPPNTRLSYEIDNRKDISETDKHSNNKKIVSLTTGFSFRKNPNNSNNPYTLTVISRPFDNYNISRKGLTEQADQVHSHEISYETTRKPEKKKKLATHLTRRTDSQEYITNDEVPQIYSSVNTGEKKDPNQWKQQELPDVQSTMGPKYFLRTVIKRPAPFSANDESYQSSTENNIEQDTLNTDELIEKALQNVRNNDLNNKSIEKIENEVPENNERTRIELPVSPYRTLSNLRSTDNVKYTTTKDYLSPATYKETSNSNQNYVSTTPMLSYLNKKDDNKGNTEQSTEMFSQAAKHILRAFFNNVTPTTLKASKSDSIDTTLQPSSVSTEKTVNIGFQNKFYKYTEDKNAPPKNVKRIEIITESKQISATSLPKLAYSSSENSQAATTAASTEISYKINTLERTKPIQQSDTSNYKYDTFDSSRKFKQIISQSDGVVDSEENNIAKYNKIDIEPTLLTNTDYATTNTTYFREQDSDRSTDDIKKSTKSTTPKTTPSTSTKSYSPFPTRASRVNPAIKLAATSLGGGRRSYQSSSNCSSDDSLQTNPKCNEIKYQRPSPTRGRGSAHYSTLNENAPPPPQTSNRGTPPTRSRPTLKPSTAIVSENTKFVDIYTNPPRRPPPVYPQPTPDKTAAKCRKDVCLLPDCYCGGKDIPGELPVESIPQLVLLTFDDSVNDLNKVLYADLFDKGRVNPNGCPISATFYVSHEWTDYSQVQNLYAAGHEMASHTISHSFGEQFSQKKWNREVGGQREILSAYGGVKLEDVRGMRAPFLSVGGNKMFKMLYDSNFTYDSSMPVYENRPPSWPYTLDYKLFHDCMIPPCPTKSYPGVWEVPMVMWQDLNGGRCSMGDACANPPAADGVYKMLLKNFDRHYTTNRAPFGLFYHAAWFTQPHHKEGFIMFLDFINQMPDVWVVTNWQALQWVRDPTPISRLNSFQPFQCNYQDRPKKCNNPKVCNLWHKSGVRYMRTCQPCPEIYPWTGKTGIKSSRIDNDIEE